MQRRLMLAGALLHEPELIFADEPTAGIDPILRERIWEYFRRLRDEGASLLVATQYVGEAAYCDRVAVMSEEPTFRNLVKALPEMLAEQRVCASLTIGVNLDQYLQPVEATLLSVNTRKFSGQSLLNRLFGKPAGPMEGIAPLHSVPRREAGGPYALPVDPELGWAVKPMMAPLFADLARGYHLCSFLAMAMRLERAG